MKFFNLLVNMFKDIRENEVLKTKDEVGEINGLLDAKKARELSLLNKEPDEPEPDITHWLKMIKDAAEKGDCILGLYTFLSKPVVKQLEELGYRYETDPLGCWIYWDEK